MGSLIGNANLIKKVYFPREVFVVSAIGSLLVSFLIELGVLAVILLIMGNMVLPWIPVVLVLVVIQSFFVLGIGFLLSVLNVYFRDVQHLIGILLMVLFYSAPIVYPIRLVPGLGARRSTSSTRSSCSSSATATRCTTCGSHRSSTCCT